MSPVIVTLEELSSIKPAWWEEGGLGLHLSSRVLTWLPQFNPGYFQIITITPAITVTIIIKKKLVIKHCLISPTS